MEASNQIEQASEDIRLSLLHNWRRRSFCKMMYAVSDHQGRTVAEVAHEAGAELVGGESLPCQDMVTLLILCA